MLNSETYPEIRNALISSSISPGEYILQAAFYGGGGSLGVVAFQVVLQLIAVLGVFGIALLAFNSPGPSLAAALLYATLPHSLVLTHQLSSEAIAVPLVVIGYWLFLEFRIADKSPGLVIAAGTVLGVSALVRPVLALLPLVIMPFAARNRSRRNIAVALEFGAVGMLPLLLCVAFFWFSAHELSLGNTSDSLEYNLYARVARVARSV